VSSACAAFEQGRTAGRTATVARSYLRRTRSVLVGTSIQVPCGTPSVTIQSGDRTVTIGRARQLTAVPFDQLTPATWLRADRRRVEGLGQVPAAAIIVSAAMEEGSDFRVSRFGADGRFKLSGELDVACSDGLVEVVRLAIEQGGEITLDMADVRFIDSSGIRALLAISRQLHGRGRLILESPSPLVRRVLDTAGAEHFPDFEIR
jgi:anti-sigma B factor antagonist